MHVTRCKVAHYALHKSVDGKSFHYSLQEPLASHKLNFPVAFTPISLDNLKQRHTNQVTLDLVFFNFAT